MSEALREIAEMIGHAIKWAAVGTFLLALGLALTGHLGAALALGLLWFALAGTAGSLLTAVERPRQFPF